MYFRDRQRRPGADQGNHPRLESGDGRLTRGQEDKDVSFSEQMSIVSQRQCSRFIDYAAAKNKLNETTKTLTIYII